MKKIFVFFSVVAIMFFIACGVPNTVPPNSDSVATTVASTGSDLYKTKCTVCHGADGKAGIMGAADLSKSTLNHAAMINVVKNGKNNMKPFAGDLTDGEIDAVVTFAESLRK